MANDARAERRGTVWLATALPGRRARAFFSHATGAFVE